MRRERRSHPRSPPYLTFKTKDISMVEVLFMAQVVRRPLEALARRWYCRGLFRATRGARRCRECTAS
jgi:hypothetical protein